MSKKNNETLSFYVPDANFVDEEQDEELKKQKTEVNQEKQKKQKTQNIKAKKQKTPFTKKQKIFISLVAISIFLLLISIFKVPYTGAIFDNLFEYFFGWSKYLVYLFLFIILIIYPHRNLKKFQKIKRYFYNPWNISFKVILIIMITLMFGVIAYLSINNFTLYFSPIVSKEFDIYYFPKLYTSSSLANDYSKYWGDNFLNSISHQNYYYTSPYAFGGIIGYINVSIFKANTWIALLVLFILFLVLTIVVVIIWKTKSQKIKNWKLSIINRLIYDINKKHKQNYFLANDEIVLSTTMVDDNHHNPNKEDVNQKDIVIDGLKEEIKKPNTSDNKQKNATNPIFLNQEINHQKQVSNEIKENNQQTNKYVVDDIEPLIKKPNDIKEYNNDIKFDKKEDIKKNEVSETEIQQSILNSSGQPKNSIYITPNQQYDIQTHNNPQLIKNYYPQLDVIGGISIEYYYELKKDAQQYLEQIKKIFEINKINPSFYSLDYVVNYFSFEIVCSFLNSELKKQFLKLYKDDFVDNIVLENNELNIYFRYDELIFNFKPKTNLDEINIADIISKVYNTDLLEIGIGKNLERQVYKLTHNDGNLILLGSAKANGRAMSINGILLSALYRNSYEELDLYIVDNNSKSLKDITKLRHTKKVAKYNDDEEIINMLKHINNQIVCEKETNDNSKITKKILLISECNDVLNSQNKIKFKTLLNNIIASSQQHKMIIILSSDFVNDEIVSLIPLFNNLILFKATNEYESQILINSPWLVNLDGFGDMVLFKDGQFNQNYIRLQCPRVNAEHYNNIIKEIQDCDYAIARSHNTKTLN